MATPGAPLLDARGRRRSGSRSQLDEARAALVATGADGLGSTRQRASDDCDGWIDGRVAEIARVDPASHSFLVKIDLPRAATLRSGLFGRARFAGPTRRALTVPASALVRRGQLTFVYLVDAEQRARLRPVSTGQRRRTTALRSWPASATAMRS